LLFEGWKRYIPQGSEVIAPAAEDVSLEINSKQKALK
jgi:hypothetical protein